MNTYYESSMDFLVRFFSSKKLKNLLRNTVSISLQTMEVTLIRL